MAGREQITRIINPFYPLNPFRGNPAVLSVEINFDCLTNIRQTLGFSKFLEFFHWKTISSSKNNAFYFVRRIPLLRSVIKIEKINVQNIDLNEIDEIAKREKACFVKIEPFVDDSKQKELDELFFPFGYTHDTWPLSSTATYTIDLQQPFEKIVANFKSKFRYNLRLAEGKNNLQIKIINGKELYHEAMRKSGDPSPTPTSGLRMTQANTLRQFTEIYNSRAKEIKSEKHSFEEILHMCESYGEKLWLLYISSVVTGQCPVTTNNVVNGRDRSLPIKNKIIMASIFLQTKDIFHYWHNGSTQEGRKLFAPTLIIAEGIKLGQKLGCKIFDFEGIYDERFVEQTKRWKGFTKFKEGFSGEKIVFAAPYIKYYSPVFRFFHFLKMI